jgi:imidazolonepropionase-like amidohydrolase
MQIHWLEQEINIRYGGLWDGTSSSPAGAGILEIRRGHIAAPEIGNAASELDCSGLFLMPALIDCHTHLSLPAGGNATERAADYISSGVTAVREAGSRHALPSFSPLRVAHCHGALTRVGAYGGNLGYAAGSMADAFRHINKLAGEGATHVKIIASGIFSFTDFGETGPPTFSAVELKQLTLFAQGLGLRVMAHVSGDQAVKNSIFAGVDSIEHGYFMSQETLADLVSAGIAWVPTLAPVEAQVSNPALRASLSLRQAETVGRSLQLHQERIGQGAALGAIIGAGTDAGAPGVPHGPSLAREMHLLSACGLSPRSVLCCATSAAADICGFTDLGRLQPGKSACILAVRDNPLQDPAVIAAPVALYLPHKTGGSG